MQGKKKTVALVESAAGNVDASFQRTVLTRYAQKYNLTVDWMIGDRAPLAGTADDTEHRNLINEIKNGGVERLLILADVRHEVPETVIAAAREHDIAVDFVDVQQERGLAQP